MKKLVLPLCALFLFGCQSTADNTAAEQPCSYFGNGELAAPSWICANGISDERFAYMAVGVSDNSAGGVAHQRNLAILDAQQQIARNMATEVIQVMQTKIGTLGVAGGSGGTSVTSEENNTMAQVSLKGVETLRTQKGPDGYFYVLLGLPESALQPNVEQMVKTQDTSTSKLSETELANQISAALQN